MREAIPDRPLLKPGASLGRYQVLELVGSGRMGEVYAAYDPRLDRRIALKRLRLLGGSEASPAARARLLREAQAMARLSHPNVVAVHDAGEVDGEVFIAMEFVGGGTLRDWLAACPRSWREVVGMFAHAGRGLAAAHAAGLVHRDFKADNVLVDAAGHVRVADFGLAWSGGPTPADCAAGGAWGDLGLTQTGALLGTPAYMAPEQLAGRTVDHRADQFAFCVALYEALYQERPFGGDRLETLALAVAFGSARPAPRGSDVPSRLRAVLLRGLSRDPVARFPSMEDLVAALVDDPMRRWGLRAGAALAAALVVGGVVALRLTSASGGGSVCQAGPERLEGVWDDRRRAAVTAAFGATRLSIAEDTAARVSAALDEAQTAWLAMYQEACEATHRRGEQSPELLDLRMACLDQRRLELLALGDAFEQANEATVKNAISAVHARPPLSTCADVAVLKARRPLPADPEARRQGDLVQAEIARAGALFEVARWDEAVRVAGVAAGNARALGRQDLLAEALLVEGRAVERGREQVRAVGVLAAAAEAALASRHDVILATTLIRAFRLASDRRWYPEAERLSRLAIGAVAALGPGHDLLQADLDCELGVMVGEQGRHEEELRFKEACIKTRRRLLPATDPKVPTAINNLALARQNLGEVGQSLDGLREAADGWERALGRDHPTRAIALGNIGQALILLDRPEEAVAPLAEAAELRERFYGADHRWARGYRADQARALSMLGRHTDALALIDQVVAPCRGKVEDYQEGSFFTTRALILRRAGRPAEGINGLDATLAYLPRSGFADDELVARTHQERGRCLLAAGRPEEAVAALERSLAAWRGHATALNEAEAAFDLAAALDAARRDRGRALGLARQAYERLGAWHDSGRLRREVGAWLAARGANPAPAP